MLRRAAKTCYFLNRRAVTMHTKTAYDYAYDPKERATFLFHLKWLEGFQFTGPEEHLTRGGLYALAGQWDRFCRALGDEAMGVDSKFATNRDRLEHRDELVERIEAILATAPVAEWVERLEAAAVPCGPIYEFDQVFEDPQVQHLGLVTEMEQPEYGPVRMLSFPFVPSATPATVRRAAPRLGEHTLEALQELGLERAEIDRLASVGAIGLSSEARV